MSGPLYPCRQPHCRVVLARPGYCPAHEAAHRRRYESQAARMDDRNFYRSVAWREVRRQRLAATPRCADCGELATEAHHRIARKQRPDLALSLGNLVALCKRCHSRRERFGRGEKHHARTAPHPDPCA